MRRVQAGRRPITGVRVGRIGRPGLGGGGGVQRHGERIGGRIVGDGRQVQPGAPFVRGHDRAADGASQGHGGCVQQGLHDRIGQLLDGGLLAHVELLQLAGGPLQ